jgi:hypothetical protein
LNVRIFDGLDEYMFVLINSKPVLKGLHFGFAGVIMDEQSWKYMDKTN